MTDFSKMSRPEVEQLIDEQLIGNKAQRNRCIMKRRLIDGICYEPLAEEFDLSVRQVKNIVRKCQYKIFK